MEINCVNSHELQLDFRTVKIKDIEENVFPIYINYENIRINNEVIIHENKVISNNQPLKIKKDLKNCETVKIHVEWKPFDLNSSFKNSPYEENKKLEKENKKLNNQLEELINSTSWKLTSVFRKMNKIK